MYSSLPTVVASGLVVLLGRKLRVGSQTDLY